MKVLFISFIEEPKSIDRIIRHLELTFEAERPPPPHHVQQELLMAAEESGEYFYSSQAQKGNSYLSHPEIRGVRVAGRLGRSPRRTGPHDRAQKITVSLLIRLIEHQ